MQQNKSAAFAPGQDDLAYQWLDENTRLTGGLKPDQDVEHYSSTLLRMVFEGQKQLAGASPEDPVLNCHLNLLLAEAQVDLALAEKGVSTRKMFVTECCEYCQQAVATLEAQGISGLACRALPRALTILTGAYQAAADVQRPAVEASLRRAADLLDKFRIQQTYERHKAVEKLLEGRIFALGTAEMANLTDRRQMLEKAAGSLRQAAGFSGLAFDDQLASEADETLAEIERCLSSASLPVPVLPMPLAPVGAPSSADATLIESRPASVEILVLSGPLGDQHFPLGDQLRLGREADNDLPLPDKKASRYHAILQRRGVVYQIIDLNSSNGTYVNEKRITKPTLLKNGDMVRIGDTKLTISTES